MNNYLNIVLSVAVLLITTGCGEKYYTQRVFNESGQEIDYVVIHYGKLQSSFGVLPPDTSATKMFMRTRPPNLAKVTWVDDKNTSYSVNVDMNIVPDNYNDGVLTFSIQKDFSVSFNYYLDTPVNIPSKK